MALRLTDFQGLKELGSGSFGSVKLVRRKDDQQLMALKTVSLSKLSQKQKDNAVNEVRLLASINIPNVIAYKGSLFDKQSASLCIFMEYADGGDLQSKVRDLKQQNGTSGFDQKYVWKVAYEILQGLKMLHSNKIIHRDIKSANIFFANGIAKLGDLNVSKVAEQGMCETQTEIWLGKSYGNKCDIWALGVLLYEMCELKMPFQGKDFPSLYRKVIQGKYTDISETYSEQLRNLIRMCLIVEDQMRPSATELQQTAILRGMEASLSSFNAQEGQVLLLDPIKCPKVLRFLAVKLPKPRFDEERKVTFTKSSKKNIEESQFKIKSVRKIRSEKHIRYQDNDSIIKAVSPRAQRKPVSRKHIGFEEQTNSRLQKVSSKKVIRLPPLQNQTRTLLPPCENKEQKRSLKHITSSRRIINLSAKHIPLQKQN